jgi:hypothetical protein
MTDEVKKTLGQIIAELFDHPWLKVVLKIVAGLGFCITIWLGWQGCFGTPLLTYEITRSQPVIAFANSRLDMRVAPGIAKIPVLTEVKIQNAGVKPIEITSFSDEFASNGNGLLLKSNNSDCEILACNVSWMHPSQRSWPLLAIVDRQKIFLKPFALNPGEEFAISFISDGNPDPVTLWGHISNCKIQKIEAANWAPWLSVLWTTYLFVGATLGVVSFVIHVQYYYAVKSLMKWLLKTVASGASGVLSVFGRIAFRWLIQTKVKTPERAVELLLSKTEFDALANEVKADTPEKRDKLREVLTEIANSTKSSVQADTTNYKSEIVEEPLLVREIPQAVVSGSGEETMKAGVTTQAEEAESSSSGS